jgi:hypothetical protein
VTAIGGGFDLEEEDDDDEDSSGAFGDEGNFLSGEYFSCLEVTTAFISRCFLFVVLLVGVVTVEASIIFGVAVFEEPM